jgi:hypothetical protein
MEAEPLRVYADTSVFGGVFDAEFTTASAVFFEQVRQDRFQLVTSAVVQAEIETAPEAVQALFNELLPQAEIAAIDEAVVRLQQGYLSAGIVTSRWAADALHVAIATSVRCTLIVSWNFKHIVHFEKIPLYNAVNTLQGYGNINIYSPREVIRYEEEDI